MEARKIIIHTDGGSRGNPGIGGAGAVITDERGEVLAEISEYLGDGVTNNYAEYEAVILALDKCAELGFYDANIEIRADSKLAIEQLNGNWKVRNPSVKKQFERVCKLLNKFKKISFKHIPRKENIRADKLANIAMDNEIS